MISADFINALTHKNGHLQQAPALLFEGQATLYQTLALRADAVASLLQQHLGLPVGSYVGVMLEPSVDMIACLCGVLQAGCAFVPLDPNLPSHQLNYMLADAQLQVVLTQSKFSMELGQLPAVNAGVELLFMDQPLPSVKALQTFSYTTDQPAYIIYTSGSSGKPKGVVCKLSSLQNLCDHNIHTFSLQGTRQLQFASISFDAAVWEIFPTLLAGGTLVLGSREELLPGQRLAEFIIQNKVESLCLAPSILGTLTAYQEQFTHLHTVVVAGEACPIALAEAWVSSSRAFYNAYGPTEGSVCATLHRFVTGQREVPIGKPLPGVNTYVLNANLAPVAPQEPGELYLGGAGVALGYLHQPELTDERFIDNPWGTGKLYRTGDLVTADLDGTLHFVSRVDTQVKIRGFRVELEAIEAILYLHPAVAAAAVKVFEQGLAPHRTKLLVGYVCLKSGAAVAEEALRRFVADRLQEYMVPHLVMQLATMPMMANLSKINRALLPDPARFTQADELGTDEALLVASFFDLALNLPQGTCTHLTDFFQAGGDSLCIAQVIFYIEKKFSIVIPSRLFYEHRTPTALVKLIAQLKQVKNYSYQAENELDLEAESQFELPEATLPPHYPTQPQASSLLVTGATGFLGAHLLAELLQRGPYSQVYCLVRAATDAEAATRLMATFTKYDLPLPLLNGCTALAADLQYPGLKLHPSTYQRLCQQVDSIYHAAADISYIRPYASVKWPNVEGTRHLLQLACKKRLKAFHHISSVSVYGATATLLNIDKVDEDYDIAQSKDILFVENGYTRAKWVAERMVGHAKALGLPVAIYRPGFIEGHSHTGVANTDDLFCRLVVGCLQMGIYPDFPGKYWLPVPVDYVAQAIAHIALNQPLGGNYNLVAERQQELSHVQLFETLNRMGYPVQAVSAKSWFAALTSLDASNALFPLVAFLREKVYHNRSTILEVHHRTANCLSTNTQAALQGSGIVCPAVDEALLTTYMNYLNQYLQLTKVNPYKEDTLQRLLV